MKDAGQVRPSGEDTPDILAASVEKFVAHVQVALERRLVELRDQYQERLRRDRATWEAQVAALEARVRALEEGRG